MKMETIVTTVTPSMAKKFLDGGGHNRNVKHHVVKKYAADMAADKWKLTHQGIAISETGQVIDGQHRLLAVIESGKHVKMPVTYNVPSESFDVMDDGSIRAARDLLSIAIPGQAYTTELTSIARGMLTGFSGGQGGTGPSKQAIMEFAVEAKDHIEPYIALQKKMRSGVAAAFSNADYMAGVPRVALEKFRDDLLSLTFTGEKDPLKQLYKRVTANTGSRADAVNLRYRLTVAAIRALIEQRPVSVLHECSKDFDSNEYKKLARKKAS